MSEQGIAIKGATMLEPSDPVMVGKEIYIVVPFDLEMTPPGQRLTRAEIYPRNLLLTVAKTWMFVDTTPGREKLKTALTLLVSSAQTRSISRITSFLGHVADCHVCATISQAEGLSGSCSGLRSWTVTASRHCSARRRVLATDPRAFELLVRPAAAAGCPCRRPSSP